MPPATRRSFSDLLKLAVEVDLREFLNVIDCPYLVATGTLAGTVTPAGATNETGFLQLEPGNLAHSPGGRNPMAGKVLAVRKAMRDDPSRIFVGRVASNDLVIDDDSVSSRHGWFERQGEALLVTDAGSRNGTFVNLERLGKGQCRAVKDEDVVTFGRVSFQFFHPLALYYALKAFSEPG